MPETELQEGFHIDRKTGTVTKVTDVVCRKGRKPWTVERIRQAMSEYPSVVFIPPPSDEMLTKALGPLT